MDFTHVHSNVKDGKEKESNTGYIDPRRRLIRNRTQMTGGTAKGSFSSTGTEVLTYEDTGRSGQARNMMQYPNKTLDDVTIPVIDSLAASFPPMTSRGGTSESYIKPPTTDQLTDKQFCVESEKIQTINFSGTYFNTDKNKDGTGKRNIPEPRINMNKIFSGSLPNIQSTVKQNQGLSHGNRMSDSQLSFDIDEGYAQDDVFFPSTSMESREQMAGFNSRPSCRYARYGVRQSFIDTSGKKLQREPSSTSTTQRTETTHRTKNSLGKEQTAGLYCWPSSNKLSRYESDIAEIGVSDQMYNVTIDHCKDMSTLNEGIHNTPLIPYEQRIPANTRNIRNDNMQSLPFLHLPNQSQERLQRFADQQTSCDKSNKGASKQRRDQINNEIGTMRDLLPLPESSRQRLSQLQIMSLSCVFIRKCNILQKLFSPPLTAPSEAPCDFSQSLTGFILVTTRDGKLVYISENVTEFLGHSMVDMKTQGDSLFDIVDKRDHNTVRAQLMQGGSEIDPDLQTSFFCRMNMSRTLKRQAGFGDVKVMHVKGHFADVPGVEPGSEQQVFMALCTPLITPDVKESLIQNNTMIFKSVHKLDMSFIEVTHNGEYHLGKTSDELANQSWYSFLHPEDIYEAREKHIQLIKSRHEMGCMMTVRMLSTTGEMIWVNIVMHVRQGLLNNSDDPVILCINQVISEEEAYQFKIQGQLFALYASRTPDFFFGSAFCTPIPSGMEANLMTSKTSPILPQPFFPRHFDTSFGSQPQPHFIQNQMQQNHSGLLKNAFEGRQGHTDTLKALKRKLTENYAQTPCKPIKMPRVMQNGSGRNGFSVLQDSTPLPSSFETNGYRNVLNSMANSSHGIDQSIVSGGPMQVMQAHGLGVTVSPKDSSYLCDSMAAYSPPARTQMEKKAKCVEQVVPDVTIPTCYLTPEPSPVSSPEPPQMKESLVSVQSKVKIDPVRIAKHLCAIKQKEQQLKNTNSNLQQPPRKLLPSLDVSFVDSFFDEINNISLSREDEIRLLESFGEKQEVIIKKEPIEDNTVNHSDAMISGHSNFDLEEFLLFSKNNGDRHGPRMEIKREKTSDDQQVLVFDCQPSPTPSSPFSTTEDKMTCDDFPSFALTPESSIVEDDVLGSDCWDLESVTVDITMPTLTKQTTLMPSVVSTADNELHQLKQLLSSWTPSGVLDSSEDSQ